MSLDLFILQQIQIYLKCAFLDFVMPFVTMLGEYGLVEIVLSLVLICVPKTRKLGFKMALALVFGLLVGILRLNRLSQEYVLMTLFRALNFSCRRRKIFLSRRDIRLLRLNVQASLCLTAAERLELRRLPRHR